MRKGLHITGLFILLGCCLSVLGQDECENPINVASKNFEAGNINETILILENCIGNKNSREEKIAAYHLLAMSYLSLNETDRAEENIQLLLSLKPDYQKYPNIDPPEFSRLMNEYKIYPKLSGGIQLGINRSSVKIKKSYSAYSTPQRYNPMTGNSLGLLLDYSAGMHIDYTFSTLLEVMGIQHVLDNAGGREQIYEEQLRSVTIGTGARYSYKLNNTFSLTPGGGMNFNFLHRSNVFFESVDNETGDRVQSIQTPIKQRNKFQPGLSLSCGLQFPVSKGMLNCGISGNAALRSTVNKEKRLDDLTFIFNNQYVNDDIKLRTWTLFIQYQIPISWYIKKMNPSEND